LSLSPTTTGPVNAVVFSAIIKYTPISIFDQVYTDPIGVVS